MMMNTTTTPAVATPDSSDSLVDRHGTADEARAARPVDFGLTDPLVRWELRARIVANQPVVQITQRMGLSATAIESFETEHFNVRNILQHSSRVLHQVIEVPPDEQWSAADVAKFWAWLGFTYGAVALDLVVPPFNALPVELKDLGLRAYLRSECTVCAEFRVLVAGKLTPTYATNTVTGRRLADKIQRASRRRARPVELLSSLCDLILQQRNATAKRELPPPEQLKESA